MSFPSTVQDVIVFRTNQAVAAGMELAISFLSHGLLCEPLDERQAALERMNHRTFRLDPRPLGEGRGYGPVIHGEAR
jgi:hypothetical protein